MKRLETGLWLTYGGEIVQHGGGHYCSKESGDFEIIQAREMHYGVPVDLFERRLANAIKKRNRRIDSKSDDSGSSDKGKPEAGSDG